MIGLDILLAEESEPRLLVEGEIVQEVDDDEAFAEAVKQAGNVLVPMSLKPDTERGEIGELETEAREVLNENLELLDPDVRDILKRRGPDADLAGAAFGDIYVRARKWAVYERVDAALDAFGEETTLEELKQRLLPNKDPNVNTAASTVKSNRRSTLPIPERLPLWASSSAGSRARMPTLSCGQA